ncbi:hypothetical protein [Oharaeibacter diazotrophicus]|uniref:Uncharacterized protein n=1 Tax=Oharaeibacter diazotrophicus TaxID=1920512 RepID=A0A4R6R9V3_9HYPH|nr:hypothetical protein [Oharaeibacter diazotrophicus]TDP82406.1 hypothetical protein EDD54_3673 [Oharaeibacter diazotrophicus]BBE72831.1 hypothetical protein OHA_1_02430 [Pleomorphomonas sp. SM30]GLS76869.1 hypothetical protein GCM10007904_22060 [Oharaeibacter diazotrophicus]
MTGEPDAGLEGRLAAQGRLVELLVAAMALSSRDPAGLVDDIELRLGPQSAEEDPGALPDRAFAVQRAADAEIERMLRSVRAMVAAANTGAGTG